MTKLFGHVVKSLVELKGGTTQQSTKDFYEKFKEECSVFTCDMKFIFSHLFPPFPTIGGKRFCHFYEKYEKFCSNFTRRIEKILRQHDKN